MEEEDRIEMRNDFDAAIKLKFFPHDNSDDDEDEDDDDDDAHLCSIPGVPDDPLKGVRRQKIKFSTEQMKGIFEQTFEEITKLVQAQVTASQEETKKNVDVCSLPGLLR